MSRLASPDEAVCVRDEEPKEISSSQTSIWVSELLPDCMQ